MDTDEKKGIDKTQIIAALIGAVAVILAAVLPLFISYKLSEKEQNKLELKLAEAEGRNQELQATLDGFYDRFSILINRPKNILTWHGHQYWVNDEPCTWHSAKTYCELLGGHLATITSEEEQEFIQKNLLSTGKYGGYWLGGSDADEEGHWEWITREEWRNPNWNNGEPSNNAGNGEAENYLIMNHVPNNNDVDGKWNDYRDQIAYVGYICEWDTDAQGAE